MQPADRTAAETGERELLAQEMTRLARAIRVLDQRVREVETVNARLELAALTTSRALAEISTHWDAVYEAMRRVDEAENNEPGP